ncbi:MAG: peptidoglycan-associated lipoprotein Pal [Elusimicrobiota bacterium]
MNATLKKIFFMFIFASMIPFSSCVKKQIKKEQSEESTIPTIKVETTTVKTPEVFEDETTEGNIRKQTDISLQTINFDFDKYELTTEAKKILSDNAKTIIENSYTVTVEGHCDERGTNQYNLSLGQKRANVVKEYYIMLGVPERNIATISYGEENPVCFESTEECWAKNRRAETKTTK